MRILDDTSDKSQPNSADSAIENRHRPRNSAIRQINEAAPKGTTQYHIYTAGPTTIAPKSTFITKSSIMRLASMTEGGMGMDSSRSLSLASYSLFFAANTLKTNITAKATMNTYTKYSHPQPALYRGPAS